MKRRDALLVSGASLGLALALTFSVGRLGGHPGDCWQWQPRPVDGRASGGWHGSPCQSFGCGAPRQPMI